MTESESEYARSPELMQALNTTLLVIDVQEKLLPHIDAAERVERNVGRLIRGAQILNVPVLLSEQYPRGLGKTTDAIEACFAKDPIVRVEKKSFSCCGAAEFRRAIGRQESGEEKQEKCRETSQYARTNLVLCGIECHVCVLQSALDLLAEGYRVFVVADAVGSRHAEDKAIALRRMEAQGVTLTSTEMTLFEWCATADNAQFKSIQSLIVQE